MIFDEHGVNQDPDYVYCKSYRHWRSGKRVFAPPGKVFRFPRRY